MIPDWLIKFFQRSYNEYIQWKLQKGIVAVSLSGVNLFYDNEWTIPFDKYNINPPYNGEGDHLIFMVSEKTFFLGIILMINLILLLKCFIIPIKLYYLVN